jgi:MoaA/NifB/PqqE/SkfB family radical SAM enzyme
VSSTIATTPSAGDLVGGLLEAAGSTAAKERFLSEANRVQEQLAGILLEAGERRAVARALALRIVNLIVARHHFHHRHTLLASRPFQLMMDSVNSCHLSCPGCLHSSNPKFRGAYDWPAIRMDRSRFDSFLDQFGPTASGLVLYNWGEPLLDKRVSDLILAAKRHLLHVCLSTNLSVRFDVPALVASGLNFLFLSIDGATAEGYSRFRRGGDFDLVIENVRRLVEERRRLGTKLPFILWRFLTFEHNVHEVERGMELARELGVDQFSVTTPFAVDWDDPGVRIARSPLEGAYVLKPDAGFKGPFDRGEGIELAEAAIDREFERSWLDRLPETGLEEPSRSSSPTCRWLYQSVTLDAASRVLPCCMAPEHGKHKVYGSFDGTRDIFNESDFRSSRLAFADREAFEQERADDPDATPPYCAVCTENPDLTYTLDRDVRRDIAALDSKSVVPGELVERLTSWPGSR